MSTLIIVESPGKTRKIRAILGAGYSVVASVGHVRDLPDEGEIGVEPPDFKPQYQPTERGKDVLKRLKADVAAADTVLLATDPDREGEAIAWHLADALHLKAPKRIAFQSITDKAVKAAIVSPRPLDMDLVHAQEARRVLDRLVGWIASPALSNATGQALSAGRVQSPAIRLVVERERAIRAFKPLRHYGVELAFDSAEGTTQWRAQWDTAPHRPAGQDRLLDEGLAARVAAVRAVAVTAFEDSETRSAPPAPFTTSTLQQAGEAKLALSPATTMELAQKLYEQGAITYHRTDAPNLSDEGYTAVAEYVRDAGLPLSPVRRSWKAKEGAQEAHEAIRPTHLDQAEAGETEQERALYRLIWARAVASQLADAVYAVRTVRLTGTTSTGEAAGFEARGKTLTDKGWKAVYDEPDEDAPGQDAGDADDNQADNPVPAIAEGQAITAANGRVIAKTTKAPPRFKESTLIKELERLGIGRPSTYAAILKNITGRRYLAKSAKGFLSPEPPGEAVVDGLVTRCQFIELDYTRALEDALDAIAAGKASYLPVVAAAHGRLVAEVAGLAGAAASAHSCPTCGKPLRRRPGKAPGTYWWGCTGYPECKTTRPDDDGKPGEREPIDPATLVYFSVPFAKREKAKKLGMRFDGQRRQWYAPDATIAKAAKAVFRT